MSKDTPAPPDYRAAAQEQGQASREITEQQTFANRPTQITPFGRVDWSATPTYDPTTGQTLNRWTQTTSLDPQQQSALDSQMQQRSQLAGGFYDRVAGEMGSPPDYSRYTALSQGPQAMSFGGSSPYVQEAEDALYGQFESRMEPRFEREQAGRRTQLYNMGLREGDEAFTRAMGDLGQTQEDARRQAQFSATIGAGQEAQRMQGMDISAGQAGFGQQLTSANFQNQLRQQQIAEDMQRRGYSLNEINALLTGQQVGMPNMPSFSQAQRSETPQYLGAAGSQGQANLDRFSAGQAGMQGLLSGLGTIGMGALMFSERDGKDYYLIGKNRSGQNIYMYRYNWDEETVPFRVGVMVEEMPSEVVYEEPLTRKKMVDYSRIDLEVV
jgi:hypothetical protein